jgi:WS/DGAT/MGAT family acyltransferase
MGYADELERQDAALFKRGDAGRLHVGTLLIFEGPPPTADELRSHVRARLSASPRTRQRVVDPPIGPLRWIDDPTFNLDYHLRRAALPRPGTDELLERNVARILSTPLDVTKPLWELWVIEGLARGHFAILAKTSYALVERGVAVDLVTALFADRPSQEALRWLPRPAPSDAQLAALGAGTLANRFLQAPLSAASIARKPTKLIHSVARHTAGAAFETAMRRGRDDRPLHSSGGQQRAFSTVTLPLSELRVVRDRFGGTIHDAVVASIAGGVRRWRHAQGLRAHGLSVSALVPIAKRGEDGGVRLDPIEMPLPLHRADPVESLRAVQAATARAVESGDALGADEIARMYRFAAPTVLADATRLAAGGDGRAILIANVPGPRETRQLFGRTLLAVFPIMPLTGERGLAAAAVSYNGSIRIGLTADPITIPDVDELSTEIVRTADFLIERARQATRPRRAPGSSPAR